MKSVDVLLVEGRKLLREGLRLQLQNYSDVRVVGEAEDLHGVTRLVEALSPHVIVVTASSVASLWVERLKTIAGGRSRPIALLLHHDADFVQAALQAGAAACLTRDATSDELVEAIRKVASGGVYLSHGLANDLAVRSVRRDEGGGTLSTRELEVLRRIADGDNTKEIAIALGVTCKTVETYRRRIMEKLDKRTVAELVKFAILKGIATLDGSSGAADDVMGVTSRCPVFPMPPRPIKFAAMTSSPSIRLADKVQTL